MVGQVSVCYMSLTKSIKPATQLQPPSNPYTTESRPSMLSRTTQSSIFTLHLVAPTISNGFHELQPYLKTSTQLYIFSTRLSRLSHTPNSINDTCTPSLLLPTGLLHLARGQVGTLLNSSSFWFHFCFNSPSANFLECIKQIASSSFCAPPHRYLLRDVMRSRPSNNTHNQQHQSHLEIPNLTTRTSTLYSLGLTAQSPISTFPPQHKSTAQHPVSSTPPLFMRKDSRVARSTYLVKMSCVKSLRYCRRYAQAVLFRSRLFRRTESCDIS
ncbi:hypothetical protein C8R42DRAFT_334779 [Lentinula raphanica]|nr:hypothetical protein C8R42DRAFT_334779 [Lentinula raphanica]